MAARGKAQKLGKPKGKRGGKRRTSWKKGQPPGSPNRPPKSPGRPPLPPDYKLAMEDLGPKGLEALRAILENPDHPRHEHAAEYVVNRWKGTPTARTEISGPGGGPIPGGAPPALTSEEKRAEVEALLKIAAERVGASSAPPDAADPDA